MQLICAEGQTVLVTSAMWGRDDTTTCSRGSNGNGNSPASMVAFANVTDRLHQLCENQNRCGVTADISMFGDPRPSRSNSALYLLANYTCKRISFIYLV